MTTLIGSRAMYYLFEDARTPVGDWDFFSPETPSDDFMAQFKSRVDVFVDSRLARWNFGPVATRNELYTIKVSHGYWDLHGTWDKHARDIRFLQKRGCVLIPELHDLLKGIWTERYKKNKISLDKSAKEFFGDAVPKKFVHDTVHESVAYHERPWFESFLKDGSEVLVDNDKFWGLPLASKLEAVREEAYVIALERKLIPHDYEGSPLAAYRWAIRRMATSLFKNEWAKFLLLNLDTLWMPDVDYVQRHFDNENKLRLEINELHPG